MNSAEHKSNSKSKSFFKGLIEELELLAIVFAIIVLLFSFVFRTCQVRGDSMKDTLYDKETVVISNFFYTPKRNDIIVFHQTGELYNEPIVKRVIGLPGDTVNIEYTRDTMIVTVIDKDGNVNVLEEDYINYDGPRFYKNSSTYVEEGTIFAMGDNRSYSADSRSSAIGLIDERKILGKVVIRLTPISRFGTVS